jgi:hypothetical protein
MTAKKENTKAKNTSSLKKKSTKQLREAHPFETGSQIQNRYGSGREKTGSDGTH